MRATRRYRGWLILLAAVIVVGILSVIATRPSETLPPFSVRDARSQGALGLYLWLARIGYHVQTQTGSDLGLQQLQPEGNTFVVMASGTDVSRNQAADVLQWVQAGGRLVLVTQGDTASELLGALGVTVEAGLPGQVRVTRLALLAPPVANLDAETSFVIGGSPDGEVAAATQYGPVLLRRAEALGQVWLLTAPDLLVNGRIARADNRRLALNLVGSPGATVRFDEASAAATSPPQTDWLTGTAWGIALLFAVAVLVLYRGLSGVRLGPPVFPVLERTRPASEYVVSLAGLLRQAHKRADILRRYQQLLRRVIVERFGAENLAALGPEGQARVARLLAPPAELTEDELLRLAADIVECEEQLRRTRV